MAEIRTEITEIVTGLGMLGYGSLERAIATRPAAVRNVTNAHFARLEAAYRAESHDELFAVSWDNGIVFARSVDGLRGRPPHTLEWKGAHRPPAYEQIPADLRVDHVYLISCKYGSRILINSSPSNLFDHRLVVREKAPIDWFAVVAPVEYQEFYERVKTDFSVAGLPVSVDDLGREHRAALKTVLPRRLSGETEAAYQAMNEEVAKASVARWKRSLNTKGRREEMVWRLLRFQAAPYFILGVGANDVPIRTRVATPWDARNRYEFRDLEVEPGARSQAVVGWRAVFHDRVRQTPMFAAGHVEVRWSHGKFGQAPEAKVYLDTPYDEVPGYFRLDGDER